MRVRVWGCRGSLATPGADTLRFGGNTSCVEVRGDSGEVLVLDAGTGMRPLGVAMNTEGAARIDVLLSHLHLDHLQGLGFFRPLFDPGREIHIWGPSSPVQSLAERISTYLSPPLFPVRLADIPAHLEFHDAPEGPVTIGSLTVRASLVTHQGPTVGYRIEEQGRAVVYLPDHEPGLGLGLSGRPVEWVSGYHLAHRATCCCTMPSTVMASIPTTSGGAIRLSHMSLTLRAWRRSTGCSSFITIRTTPMTNWS